MLKTMKIAINEVPHADIYTPQKVLNIVTPKLLNIIKSIVKAFKAN